jgi:hypothetical protein
LIPAESARDSEFFDVRREARFQSFSVATAPRYCGAVFYARDVAGGNVRNGARDTGRRPVRRVAQHPPADCLENPPSLGLTISYFFELASYNRRDCRREKGREKILKKFKQSYRNVTFWVYNGENRQDYDGILPYGRFAAFRPMRAVFGCRGNKKGLLRNKSCFCFDENA